MVGASELTGQVAVVTGAGHGIGAAIGSELARMGAAVVVNDIDAGLAADSAREILVAGGEAAAVPADIADPDEVERLMAEARSRFGAIDILVNNARVQRNKAFVEHTVEDWDAVFAVNTRAAFLCMRAVVPSMIERGRGNVVNIASIAAFHTTPPHVAYAASKAALVALTRDVAAEVAPYGVRVNAVAPGPTQTRIPLPPDAGGVLVGRVGVPADIAAAVAYLVSDAASFVVGETLRVAGGADLRVGARHDAASAVVDAAQDKPD